MGLASAQEETRIEAQVVGKGVAMGVPFFYTHAKAAISARPIAPEEVEKELQRYQSALSRCRQELKLLRSQEQGGEGEAILNAQVHMLEDPLFTTEIEEELRKTPTNIEAMLTSLLKKYREQFESLGDPFFLERFGDIEDVGQRLLEELLGTHHFSLKHAPTDSILIAEEVTPTEVAEIDVELTSAILTERGGATSHAAIMAASKGLPYLSQISIPALKEHSIHWMIVDGDRGEVIVNPSKETLTHYRKQQLQHERFELLPATKTKDGSPVKLSINLDAPSELATLPELPIEGVGLFRSEYLALARRGKLPTEEEQYNAYCDLINGLDGRYAVIRTFDFAGDKAQLLDVPLTQEIKERLLHIQFRAILRASAHGDVRVLLPMIAGVAEIRVAKEGLHRACEELLKEGIEIGEHLPVGCMIEIPSAAMTADLIAQEADFFSIGTNDLTQYTLGTNREETALPHALNDGAPGLLRLVHQVCAAARQHQLEVTICGHLAADPRFAPLLIGLGIDTLSMPARMIPAVQEAIGTLEMKQCEGLAKLALQMETADEMRALLASVTS